MTKDIHLHITADSLNLEFECDHRDSLQDFHWEEPFSADFRRRECRDCDNAGLKMTPLGEKILDFISRRLQIQVNGGDS